MSKGKKILLYRTSGTTEPPIDDIECGELAMSYLADNEKLYIKNTNDKITSFIGNGILNDKLIKLQDPKLVFTVTPSHNSDITENTIYFKSQYSGNTTITKITNDNVRKILLNQSTANTATLTSTISASKETFIIETIPISDNDTPIVKSETRYMCFLGASTAETVNKNTYTTFGKELSDGNDFSKTIHTNRGEYAYVIVPKSLHVLAITADGIKFKTNDAVDVQGSDISMNDVVAHVASGETKPYVNYDAYIKDETTIDNPEYTEAVVDSEGKILYSKSNDGTVYQADLSSETVSDEFGDMVAYRSTNLLDDADWNIVVQLKK